ncbi:hypothetical protein Cgig2_017309 [Carnegiea gigantea]|uniref:Uncharacterized protein n=1 Tax=Carnegiea gigantea TaxID=171969 RepID=A0A9Q1GUH0_9CARY|nr:hypothetical protein Cgig2_017309 [Carnegiea gigantea]
MVLPKATEGLSLPMAVLAHGIDDGGQDRACVKFLLLSGVLPMAFPHSLDTKAMSEYVTRHFAWDRHFELAVAEEAAKYYELPELPQVIFYAIPLNEAQRLGDGRFDHWSRPSLSSVRALLRHGSDYLVTGSTRLDSAQRVVQGRGREPILPQFLLDKYIIILPQWILAYSSFQRSGRKYREGDQCPCFLNKHGISFYLQYEKDGKLHEGDLHLVLEECLAPTAPPP